MSDPVISFRPEPGEYAWTFGGAAPVLRIRPGAVLEVFTEDCFAGRVRGENDLVSRGVRVPVPEPADRPVLRRGRRARRHAGGALRLDRAGPRLGGVHHRAAVRGADRDPPDRAAAASRCRSWCGSGSWTAAARTCRFTARRERRSRSTCRWTRCTARSGWPRPTWRCAARWCRMRFGGNMDTPEMRAGVTCYLGVNVPGALLSPRRRARPPGRGRDVRRRGRDGDEHGDRGRPDQGAAVPVAAAGVRRRTSCRPGRPGRWRTRSGSPSSTWCSWIAPRLRAGPAGRLPAGDAGGGVAAGQRVRHQLHLDRQDPQALPASGPAMDGAHGRMREIGPGVPAVPVIPEIPELPV